MLYLAGYTATHADYVEVVPAVTADAGFRVWSS